MLRTKNLVPFSQSARSFLLNGSRSSAADGNSSGTRCDDETATVKHLQSSTKLPSKSPVVVSSPPSIDSIKESNSKKPENAPHSQGVPTPRVLDNKTNSVSHEEEIAYSSPPIADHLVKAGMATLDLFYALANNRTPKTDGSAMIITAPPNYMVRRTKPISSVRSANVKTSRKDVKPSPEPVSVYNTQSVAADKSGFATGVVENDAGDNNNRKKPVPQRTRAYSNKFVEGKLSCNKSDGFSREIRQTKVLVNGAATQARPFISCSPIVESVSKILHHLKWGPSTEEALSKLNCTLDAYQANQILKQLQDYNVALGFFYWLKRKPWFRHDGHTYTTMVGILGRARQFGAINKLLDQMIEEGCYPNTVTYNRIIHSYGRANYLTQAMNVFNEMEKLGCEPDRVTYCTLIDIHAKAGYLEVAIDMYQRMQQAGLSPDTFTYSVIINCLGKAGHLAAAHKLFCEMVNNGCVPNLVTYNIMIALHAKARNYESSLQLYRDMQSAGFQPDKVTYSIVMEVYGHCGYLEEAERVFSEMKRKKWVPDEPVYGLLVDLWGKSGNVEKAREWYDAMLSAGLRPNVPTCNSLLSAFLRVHRLKDASDILQNMLGLGLNPSLQTYTLLLSCCTEAQTSFDMDFCCELMTVTGHPAHNFLLSMPSAGPTGQNVRDHVGNFLDMMHSEDRESKRGLVDAVIDFFHKTGLKEEAGSVWEVAAQRNVYPDALKRKSSSYWLINLHVMSDGTAVTALSRTLAWFRREMLESGFGPTRIDIVTGWGRRSRVTGSSLVRQSVQELLNMFGFPFFTENGNSGCFIGCGEPLNRWLLQSYVERMHLV